MSMESNLLVICGFDESIVDYLGYSASFYDDTEENTLIITTLFNCWTTSQSRVLANDFLHIDEWNFNQHDVTNKLNDIIEKHPDNSYFDNMFEEDIIKLKKLAPYIKYLFFIPNG